MNIWIISLFDPTPIDEPISPRFISIAEAAVRRGHFVTHFTSTFRHINKTQRFEKSKVHKENDNYEVAFIRSMSYKHNMLPKRYIAHLDFAKKLIKKMDSLPKPDAIFMSMPPLSTVDLVTKWGKKNNVPVTIDIIDPWPDSFIKDVPKRLKPIAKLIFSPFYLKLQRAFDNSAAITAISNGYLKWGSKYYDENKKTGCFYLAIDYAEIQESYSQFEKVDLHKDPSVLRLIYAGSLASSYDIPAILKAAKALDKKHPNKTEFVITGKGPQKDLILEVEKETTNLKYLGWLSKVELLKQYYLADVGLIQHKNSLTQTITYKFFNYSSSGLVLLNSLQTEMADLIEINELGLNNSEENWEELVANIEFLINNPKKVIEYKKNALSFAAKEGNSSVVYDNLVAFIEDTTKN